MGCKECMGRYGLLVCAVIFSVGMLVSTLTPSWIETVVEHPPNNNGVVTATIVEFGPFYSQTQDCTINPNNHDERTDCTEWVSNEIDNNDCNSFSPNQDIQEKLCRQHNTWRVLAMCCMFIVVGTACLVAVATCTQCLTCGCCGGSFDAIASVAYWIEVALSIVCWSFCISVVLIIRDMDIKQLAESEVENIGDAEKPEDLLNGNFLWGFWIFIFSGTFVGSLCAIFADWAAEGSLLRCFVDCLACVFCCKKK